jgi:hypothetical protein
VNNINVSPESNQLLIYNDGTGPVFVRVKPQGVVLDASVADLPIPSKGTRIITKDPGSFNIVSVFSLGAAVGNVYICPGEGYGGN